MCDKAVNRCFYMFDSISDQYKTQKTCDRAFFTALYADGNILVELNEELMPIEWHHKRRWDFCMSKNE